MNIKKVYSATRKRLPNLIARTALDYARWSELHSRITKKEERTAYNYSVEGERYPRYIHGTPSEYFTAGGWNREWSVSGYRARFVDNSTPQNSGLRFVGYCDEILERLAHKGWYSDDMQHETYRGAVYQVAGKKGKEQYMAGYRNSDDPNSPVMAMYYHTDKRDAALYADDFAEVMAGRDRAYQERFTLEQQLDYIYFEILSERQHHTKLVRHIPKYRLQAFVYEELKATASNCRSTVRGLIKQLREKRDEYNSYNYLERG